MPGRRKRRCPCNMCKSTLDPIDHRTVCVHLLRYGNMNLRDSPLKFQSQTDNIAIITKETTPGGNSSSTHRNEKAEGDSSSSSIRKRLRMMTFVLDEVDMETNSSIQAEQCDDGIHNFVDDESSSVLEDTPDMDQEINTVFCCEKDQESFESCEEFEHATYVDSTDGSCTSDDFDDSARSNSSHSDDEELTAHVNGPDEWSFTYDKSQYTKGIAVEKFPHNSNFTVLQWLAMNFHLFTSHPTISKNVFSNHIKLQNFVNSQTNQDGNINAAIPTTYHQARKLIEPFVIRKKIYHSCANDCVIFKSEEEKRQPCQTCKSLERKRFVYLPIGPRLARSFGEVNLAKLLQAHTGHSNTNTVMWDVHDSPAWKKLYSNDGYFSGEKNGLAFAFEIDGVNPFHNIGVQYSMTPMMLTLLNLPRHLRNGFGNILLVGIIPGSGRTEASKLDPYIEIMVDEMLYLTSCRIVDSYIKAPIEVKIKLLFYVMDYPGLSKVFNQQGSGGLSACHWCHVRGEYFNKLNKVIYPSNFPYLSPEDRLRTNCQSCKQQPKSRIVELENSCREAYDKTVGKTNKDLIASATGCKGVYTLKKLPGHNRIEETHPDACHTIKDVVQNIMKVLTNKSLDINKIIQAEMELGRNTTDLQVNERKYAFQLNKIGVKKGKNVTASGNPYTFMLTENELKIADTRASSIRPPLDFGVKPSPFISKSGSLKSHDWKQIACHGILKFCLRGCLAAQCRETLFYFLDVVAELCQEHQCLDDLPALDVKVNRALALLERDFPLSLQNITTHILHHIVRGIKNFGPVYGTWMFVFERFNSWICKRVLNMRHPESTVMETFIVYEWCQFMINSDKMPPGFSTLFLENDLNTPNNVSSMQAKSRKYVSTDKELRLLHKVCVKCACNQTSSNIVKHYYHKTLHPNTGRVIKYSCLKSQRRSAKTNSSYVCFELERGRIEHKVSSAKFLYFGQIAYFLSHTNDRNGEVDTFATITICMDPCFDEETRMWFCPIKNRKQINMTIQVKALSNPLVTAEDNCCIWFLDSNKWPYIGN